MNSKIDTYFNNKGLFELEYKEIPDECPYCHIKISPTILSAYGYEELYYNGLKKISQVVFQCPNQYCRNLFIAKYVASTTRDLFIFQSILSTTLKTINFSEHISKLSPDFPTIYNQAYFAEQYELKQICGSGYRKALEFLIKDFAINNTNNEVEKERIRANFLGDVINNHISDPKIKMVASRAAWLGNDEIHYLRKWKQQDLDDLKILIELTIHFIESILLTKYYEEQMPDK